MDAFLAVEDKTDHLKIKWEWVKQMEKEYEDKQRKRGKVTFNKENDYSDKTGQDQVNEAETSEAKIGFDPSPKNSAKSGDSKSKKTNIRWTGLNRLKFYTDNLFDIFGDEWDRKYGLKAMFKKLRLPKGEISDPVAFSFERFMKFIKVAIKKCFDYEIFVPFPSTYELLRARIMKLYKKLSKLLVNELVDVNDKSYLKISYFSRFFDELRTELNRFDHYKADRSIDKNLSIISGLFPVGKVAPAGMSRREFLFYRFLQVNQRSFSVNDLKTIFCNFQVFGFRKEHFINEPTPS